MTAPISQYSLANVPLGCAYDPEAKVFMMPELGTTTENRWWKDKIIVIEIRRQYWKITPSGQASRIIKCRKQAATGQCHEHEHFLNSLYQEITTVGELIQRYVNNAKEVSFDLNQPPRCKASTNLVAEYERDLEFIGYPIGMH